MRCRVVAKRIKANELDKEIQSMLSTYVTDVSTGLEELKKKEARETIKEVRANVDSQGLKRTGEYRKGWGYSTQGSSIFIRNRHRYQLTHLLEKGHAKRGGGRVRAYPHIGPAEQNMIKRYTKGIERLAEK